MEREQVILISIFILLFSRRLTSNYVAIIHLFLRMRRRRRMQLRFMQELAALYTYLRSRRLATRRKPRSAWVFPRPQNWFEELLTNRAVDFWWKENFRVSRVTFDRICHLVGPALERQNTRFREAIPVTFDVWIPFSMQSFLKASKIESQIDFLPWLLLVFDNLSWCSL